MPHQKGIRMISGNPLKTLEGGASQNIAGKLGNPWVPGSYTLGSLDRPKIRA
jgi:hypothetical protein